MSRDVRQKDYASILTAFEAEALPHLNRLFRIAMWLMQDRVKAETLVQETLTQGFGSFHRFETGTNCCAWLVQIMYRVKDRQQHLRDEQAKIQLVSKVNERATVTIRPELATPKSATQEEILRALRNLSQGEQEVIMLSDVEELTYKEVADTLGIPVSRVIARLLRARSRLRTELAGFANRSNEEGRRNLLSFADRERR